MASSAASTAWAEAQALHQEIKDVSAGDGSRNIIALQRPALILLGVVPGAQGELQNEHLACLQAPMKSHVSVGHYQLQAHTSHAHSRQAACHVRHIQ